MKNTKTKILIGARGMVGYAPSVTFDGAWVSKKYHGNFMFSFDGDEDETVYTVMYPLMAEKGFKGTLYINKDRVGSAKNCTLSQLHELYDAGWAIANHGATHVDFTTLTAEQAYDNVLECQEYLLNNGFTRAARHFAYPVMAYNDISDAAISPLCESIRQGYIFQTNKYPFQLVGVVPRLHTTGTLSNVVSEATIKLVVDQCILNGGTAAMLGHGIEDPPVNAAFCSTERFTYLVTYLSQQKVNVITVDEWFHGLTNPRYRSLPLGRT